MGDDIIYVTQLLINGESVYRLESSKQKVKTLELKQFIADAMTGKEIEQ